MVIKNVANKEQQETAVSLFWDLCESKQPSIKRDKPSSWDTAHWVASPSVGIMSGILSLFSSLPSHLPSYHNTSLSNCSKIHLAHQNIFHFLIFTLGYGIGQSEFLWYARLLPKVREAFSLIWADDDLLVSYDGCGVFRPPEVNEEWRTQGAWYHIDQNLYNRPGLHAIQVDTSFSSPPLSPPPLPLIYFSSLSFLPFNIFLGIGELLPKRTIRRWIRGHS